ncbi:MAG: asparagine synthase (glutamine-hydrolyzing) [Verrucomicrobia bacterium]|nr:asparagine synthase (glutamine-hydrolyzing) [Verrucomicrobiota bacterium]
MCAIVCRYLFNRSVPSDDGVLARAMASLRHRGPDGTGTWSKNRIEIGHCRLAIISPEDGQEPVVDKSAGVALTFNGEIYNYREIRQRLIGCGHVFRTNCDAEALLRGYIEFGMDVLQHLNGIFAFVIYDEKRHLVFGARDHLGVKPLYYYRDEQQFICASEIKGLFCDARVPRKLRQDTLFEYLVFGFVAGPNTLYEGIYQLEPAHWFTILDREFTIGRFWKAKGHADLIQETGEALDCLEAKIRRAVRYQLISDVPLAALLSGGVDSSLMTLFANQEQPGIQAFTLRHPSEGYDETQYATMVSEANGIPLHTIDIDSADALELLRKVTWFYDEPIIQTNTIGLYKLCREISRFGVKVLLSGEGADETFGGYDRYRESLRAYRSGKEDVVVYGRNEVAFPRIERFWPNRQRRFDFRERLATDLKGEADGNQLLLYDQSTYLPHLLQRQDRMGMACGIEVRVPFLDWPLVEYANRLAPELKIHPTEGKFILKRLAERYLPHELVHRPKQAFDTPIAESLARGEFNTFFKDSVSPNARIATLFDLRGIEGLMTQFERGNTALWRILWQVLCVEVWMSTFEVET